MIRAPPAAAAPDRGVLSGGGSSWSTRATRKIVRRAATEDRTGEVSEMRTRKEPEKTCSLVSNRSRKQTREEPLTRIRKHAYRQHPRRLSARQLKGLEAGVVQQRQRDPQHRQREQPDAGADKVCENHAAPRARAVGRAGEALVQDLVEAVQHGADADDDVAERAVARLVGRGRVAAARAAARLAAVLRRRRVAVRNDKHARNGDEHSRHLSPAQALAQQRDAKGVREEGAAVVDCREVARRRHVDGDVPAAAGDGEGRCDARYRLGDVRPRRDAHVPRRRVGILPRHHLCRLAQDLDVPAPEDGPGQRALLEAQEAELEEPEHGPGAVREVAVCVGRSAGAAVWRGRMGVRRETHSMQ